MKNLKRFTGSLLAIAALVGIFSVADTFGQNKIREIKKRMDDHNKTLTTLRTDVTMVKFNSQLRETDTTLGTAIYAKGKGKYPYVRVDWKRPEESLAVVDGTYYLYKAMKPEGIVYTGSVSKFGSKDGKPKGSSAFAFVNMSKAELDANYDVSYINEETLSNGVQAVHLQLVPKISADYKLADLWVDVNGMPVQSKITEKNDDTTTILLSKPQKNVNLKTSDFKINWPSGTKVQKT